ncbi:FxSxx-COOH cyclophane-containing RiPP peptide [Streptomyces zagrosensis]|uniref:FXSXX-COOH protein n=1 Tax=Streptomyces zagrosensis TaxID=1042984 RepID=A0A7W9QB79_9ACTN|nr:FXSXX-COOH protein [Streptomyces zagrosensis]
MSRDSTAHESTTGEPSALAPPVTRAPVMAAPATQAPVRQSCQTVEATDQLPDLLSLDLATLRTLEHPVLDEVLGELRGRVAQPREMLWAFNSAC